MWGRDLAWVHTRKLGWALSVSACNLLCCIWLLMDHRVVVPSPDLDHSCTSRVTVNGTHMTLTVVQLWLWSWFVEWAGNGLHLQLGVHGFQQQRENSVFPEIKRLRMIITDANSEHRAVNLPLQPSSDHCAALTNCCPVFQPFLNSLTQTWHFCTVSISPPTVRNGSINVKLQKKITKIHWRIP